MKRGKGKFCSFKCNIAYRRRRVVTNTSPTKVCSTCKKIISSKDFLFRKDTRDKKSTQCSDCRKKTVLRSKYHLSKKEAEILFYKQHYKKCECCGLTAKDNIKKYQHSLNVDHDHNTGKIRGILCYKCNVILGHSADSTDYLYLLIKYLNRTFIQRTWFLSDFSCYYKEETTTEEVI